MSNSIDSVTAAEYDMHSAEYNADPNAYFKKYREKCPAGWSEKNGGFWFVTEYDDVTGIMRDTDTFSSASGLMIGIDEVGDVKKLIPEEVDPPELSAYRKFFTTELSPRAVAANQDRIRYWTTLFVDRIIESGSANFVDDLVNPVPACVTLEWLGLSTDDWEMFALPMHNFSGHSVGTEGFDEAIRGIEHFQKIIKETVALRRTDPRDDFISYLTAQKIGDRPLDDDEVEAMVFLAIAGGTETTASLTVSTLVYLSDKPELRARLVAEPELFDPATEEFLRYFSPVKAHARTVTTDTTMAGCPMHAKDKVQVNWAAANHDPKQFADPDEFDPGRFPNRHVAFGVGPHRCLGSHLARAMFKEMVMQVLRRMPDYRVVTDQLASYPSAATIGGWNSAPALFTPNVRELA